MSYGGKGRREEHASSGQNPHLAGYHRQRTQGVDTQPQMASLSLTPWPLEWQYDPEDDSECSQPFCTP